MHRPQDRIRARATLDHLEPVNGAAIDQRGILAQALSEGATDGAEAEHDVQIGTAGPCEVGPLLHSCFCTLGQSCSSHHLQHLKYSSTQGFHCRAQYLSHLGGGGRGGGGGGGDKTVIAVPVKHHTL